MEEGIIDFIKGYSAAKGIKYNDELRDSLTASYGNDTRGLVKGLLSDLGIEPTDENIDHQIEKYGLVDNTISSSNDVISYLDRLDDIDKEILKEKISTGAIPYAKERGAEQKTEDLKQRKNDLIVEPDIPLKVVPLRDFVKKYGTSEDDVDAVYIKSRNAMQKYINTLDDRSKRIIDSMPPGIHEVMDFVSNSDVFDNGGVNFKELEDGSSVLTVSTKLSKDPIVVPVDPSLTPSVSDWLDTEYIKFRQSKEFDKDLGKYSSMVDELNREVIKAKDFGKDPLLAALSVYKKYGIETDFKKSIESGSAASSNDFFLSNYAYNTGSHVINSLVSLIKSGSEIIDDLFGEGSIKYDSAFKEKLDKVLKKRIDESAKQVLYGVHGSTTDRPLMEQLVDVDGNKLIVNDGGDVIGARDSEGRMLDMGDEKVKDSVKKYMSNKSNYEPYTDFSYKSMFYKSGQIISDMAPIIASTMTMPGSSGIWMSTFLTQYGDFYKDQYEKTGDGSNAALYAILASSATAYLEGITGIEGRILDEKSLLNLSKKVADEAVINNIYSGKKFHNLLLKRLYEEVPEETAVELSQSLAEGGIQYMMNGKSDITKEELLETAILTPVATMPMTTVTSGGLENNHLAEGYVAAMHHREAFDRISGEYINSAKDGDDKAKREAIVKNNNEILDVLEDYVNVVDDLGLSKSDRQVVYNSFGELIRLVSKKNLVDGESKESGEIDNRIEEQKRGIDDFIYNNRNKKGSSDEGSTSNQDVLSEGDVVEHPVETEDDSGRGDLRNGEGVVSRTDFIGTGDLETTSSKSGKTVTIGDDKLQIKKKRGSDEHVVVKTTFDESGKKVTNVIGEFKNLNEAKSALNEEFDALKKKYNNRRAVSHIDGASEDVKGVSNEDKFRTSALRLYNGHTRESYEEASGTSGVKESFVEVSVPEDVKTDMDVNVSTPSVVGKKSVGGIHEVEDIGEEKDINITGRVKTDIADGYVTDGGDVVLIGKSSEDISDSDAIKSIEENKDNAESADIKLNGKVKASDGRLTFDRDLAKDAFLIDMASGVSNRRAKNKEVSKEEGKKGRDTLNIGGFAVKSIASSSVEELFSKLYGNKKGKYVNRLFNRVLANMAKRLGISTEELKSNIFMTAVSSDLRSFVSDDMKLMLDSFDGGDVMFQSGREDIKETLDYLGMSESDFESMSNEDRVIITLYSRNKSYFKDVVSIDDIKSQVTGVFDKLSNDIMSEDSDLYLSDYTDTDYNNDLEKHLKSGNLDLYNFIKSFGSSSNYLKYLKRAQKLSAMSLLANVIKMDITSSNKLLVLLDLLNNNINTISLDVSSSNITIKEFYENGNPKTIVNNATGSLYNIPKDAKNDGSFISYVEVGKRSKKSRLPFNLLTKGVVNSIVSSVNSGSLNPVEDGFLGDTLDILSNNDGIVASLKNKYGIEVDGNEGWIRISSDGNISDVSKLMLLKSLSLNGSVKLSNLDVASSILNGNTIFANIEDGKVGVILTVDKDSGRIANTPIGNSKDGLLTDGDKKLIVDFFSSGFSNNVNNKQDNINEEEKSIIQELNKVDKELEEQKNKENNKIEESPVKVIYTGLFINTVEVVKKYKPKLKNIFSHHVTFKFKPGTIEGLNIGEVRKFKVIGRLTTDKVDVLLVDAEGLSDNEFPHITLATAEGVKPFESNNEIKNNLDRVIKLNDEVTGVIGYFNGDEVVLENKNLKQRQKELKDKLDSIKKESKSNDLIASGLSNIFIGSSVITKGQLMYFSADDGVTELKSNDGISYGLMFDDGSIYLNDNFKDNSINIGELGLLLGNLDSIGRYNLMESIKDSDSYKNELSDAISAYGKHLSYAGVVNIAIASFINKSLNEEGFASESELSSVNEFLSGILDRLGIESEPSKVTSHDIVVKLLNNSYNIEEKYGSSNIESLETKNINEEQSNVLSRVLENVRRKIAKRLGITFSDYSRRSKVRVIENIQDSLSNIQNSLLTMRGLSSEFINDMTGVREEGIDIKFQKVPKKHIKNNGLSEVDRIMSYVLDLEDSFKFLGFRGKLSALSSKDRITEEINKRLGIIVDKIKNTNEFLFQEFAPGYLETTKEKETVQSKKDAIQEMIDGNRVLLDENIKNIQEVQRGSLLNSVNYLMANNEYSPEFKYLMLGLILKGNVAKDREVTDKNGKTRIIRGKKAKRNRFTVGNHQELSPMVLPKVYEVMNEEGNDKHPMEIYAENIDNSFLTQDERIDIVKDRIVKKTDNGYWVLFKRSSNPSDIGALTLLSKEVSKEMGNDSWCTGGGMASTFLPKGDFYIFVDKSYSPKITIRYEGDMIAELKGTGPGQIVTKSQNIEAREFLPDIKNGIEYIEQVDLTDLHEFLKSGNVNRDNITDKLVNTFFLNGRRLETFNDNELDLFNNNKKKYYNLFKEKFLEVTDFEDVVLASDVNSSSVFNGKKVLIYGDLNLIHTELNKNFSLEGATITGDLYIKYIELNENFSLEGATINGDLSFQYSKLNDNFTLDGATITGDLNFNETKLNDSFNLDGVTINGDLIIIDTKLNKNFSLKGATINGSLDIRAVDLNDSFTLEGATINGNLYFSKIELKKNFSLKGATINGSLDIRTVDLNDGFTLDDANIGGDLIIDYTELNDSFSLDGVTINGSIEISHTKFNDNFTLDGATINGYLNFNETKLNDSFNLDGVTINSGIRFEDSKLNKNFSLEGVTINGDLWFRYIEINDSFTLEGATINGDLYLSETELNKNFSLKGATINGDLIIIDTKLNKNFSLKGATINGSLEIIDTELNDIFTLEGITIKGSLKLTDIELKGKFSLKGATINGDLYFAGVKLNDNFTLEGATINGDLYLDNVELNNNFSLKDTTVGGSLNLSGASIDGKLLTEEEIDNLESQVSRVVKNQDIRGAFIETPISTLILLDRNNADVTTPIHEVIHEYEKVLTKEEIGIIESWSGHRYGTLKFSEAFAVGAERYIYEGHADTAELGNIFGKLVKWFKAVIKDAISYFGGINELSPDIISIYDSIFNEDENEVSGDVKFQGEDSSPRGLSGTVEEKMVILLSKEYSDVTTPLHEIAHLYESVLTADEKRAILDWAGHKRWSTATSELFAGGFERFLFEGGTETPALRNIFIKFANWLKSFLKEEYFKDVPNLNYSMLSIYESMLLLDGEESKIRDDINRSEADVVSDHMYRSSDVDSDLLNASRSVHNDSDIASLFVDLIGHALRNLSKSISHRATTSLKKVGRRVVNGRRVDGNYILHLMTNGTSERNVVDFIHNVFSVAIDSKMKKSYLNSVGREVWDVNTSEMFLNDFKSYLDGNISGGVYETFDMFLYDISESALSILGNNVQLNEEFKKLITKIRSGVYDESVEQEGSNDLTSRLLAAGMKLKKATFDSIFDFVSNGDFTGVAYSSRELSAVVSMAINSGLTHLGNAVDKMRLIYDEMRMSGIDEPSIKTHEFVAMSYALKTAMDHVRKLRNINSKKNSAEIQDLINRLSQDISDLSSLLSLYTSYSGLRLRLSGMEIRSEYDDAIRTFRNTVGRDPNTVERSRLKRFTDRLMKNRETQDSLLDDVDTARRSYVIDKVEQLIKGLLDIPHIKSFIKSYRKLSEHKRDLKLKYIIRNINNLIRNKTSDDNVKFQQVSIGEDDLLGNIKLLAGILLDEDKSLMNYRDLLDAMRLRIPSLTSDMLINAMLTTDKDVIEGIEEEIVSTKTAIKKEISLLDELRRYLINEFSPHAGRVIRVFPEHVVKIKKLINSIKLLSRSDYDIDDDLYINAVSALNEISDYINKLEFSGLPLEPDDINAMVSALREYESNRNRERMENKLSELNEILHQIRSGTFSGNIFDHVPIPRSEVSDDSLIELAQSLNLAKNVVLYYSEIKNKLRVVKAIGRVVMNTGKGVITSFDDLYNEVLDYIPELTKEDFYKAVTYKTDGKTISKELEETRRLVNGQVGAIERLNKLLKERPKAYKKPRGKTLASKLLKEIETIAMYADEFFSKYSGASDLAMEKITKLTEILNGFTNGVIKLDSSGDISEEHVKEILSTIRSYRALADLDRIGNLAIEANDELNRILDKEGGLVIDDGDFLFERTPWFVTKYMNEDLALARNVLFEKKKIKRLLLETAVLRAAIDRVKNGTLQDWEYEALYKTLRRDRTVRKKSTEYVIVEKNNKALKYAMLDYIDSRRSLTTGRFIDEVVATPRLLKLAADVSFILNQGYLALTKYIWSNPKVLKLSLTDLAKSMFSHSGWIDTQVKLEEEDYYEFAIEYGVKFVHYDNINAEEELNLKSVLERIPIIGDAARAVRTFGSRSWSSYMNRLRYEFFKEALEAGVVNPNSLRAWAEEVNLFTGSTSKITGIEEVDEGLNSLIDVGAKLIIAPRWYISIFKSLGALTMLPSMYNMAFKWRGLTKEEIKVEELKIKSRLKTLVGVAMWHMTGVLLNATLNPDDDRWEILNPFNPNFLKVKHGKGRVTAISPLVPFLRFMFRSAMIAYMNNGDTKKLQKKYNLSYSQKRVNNFYFSTADFFKYRMVPFYPAFVEGFIFNRDWKGDKVTNKRMSEEPVGAMFDKFTFLLKAGMTPIVLEGIIDNVVSRSSLSNTAIESFADVTGFNSYVQPYYMDNNIRKELEDKGIKRLTLTLNKKLERYRDEISEKVDQKFDEFIKEVYYNGELDKMSGTKILMERNRIIKSVVGEYKD